MRPEMSRYIEITVKKLDYLLQQCLPTRSSKSKLNNCNNKLIKKYGIRGWKTCEKRRKQSFQMLIIFFSNFFSQYLFSIF